MNPIKFKEPLHLTLEPADEDGNICAGCDQLGAFTDGKTLPEAWANLLEAVQVSLECQHDTSQEKPVDDTDDSPMEDVSSSALKPPTNGTPCRVVVSRRKHDSFQGGPVVRLRHEFVDHGVWTETQAMYFTHEDIDGVIDALREARARLDGETPPAPGSTT